MSFLVKEVNMEMSEAEAWATVERVGEMLNVPGVLQGELSLDPVHGPRFKELTKKLLHLVVDHYDIGVSAQTDEDVKAISDTFKELLEIQNDHMLEQIGKFSAAIQFLPFDQVITSIDEDFAKLGVSEEQVAHIKKETDTDDASAAVAQLDKRIARVLSAGIVAAGGQPQFADMQMHVMKTAGEELSKMHPINVFAAQVGGALSMALVQRSNTPEFFNATMSSTIESIIGAKRAITLPTVAMWHLSAGEAADYYTRSLNYNVNRRLEGVAQRVAEDEAAEAAKTADFTADAPKSFNAASVMPGNGTIN